MLLIALDLLGTSVFAISGALAAGRKGLDLLGVLVLALVTAVGGGTIRDVLLGRHPIFWLADPRYLAAILVAALGTVSGSAGGAVRDVLCAEIPLVLRRGNLYASAAIAGTSVYFGLAASGMTRAGASLIGAAVIVSVRLAAIRWDVRLPTYQLPEPPGSA